MEKSTAAASDARQITSALRRVHKTISSSVMNADEAVSVLLQDGAILEDTLQDHKYGLKSSLQTTKYRLDRIKSAETRETYSIFLSLSFFTTVVIYIIAKRTRLLTVAWLAIHGVIRGGNLISSLTATVTDIKEVSVLDFLSDTIRDHESDQMPFHAISDKVYQLQTDSPIDLLAASTPIAVEVNVEGEVATSIPDPAVVMAHQLYEPSAEQGSIQEVLSETISGDDDDKADQIPLRAISDIDNQHLADSPIDLLVASTPIVVEVNVEGEVATSTADPAVVMAHQLYEPSAEQGSVQEDLSETISGDDDDKADQIPLRAISDIDNQQLADSPIDLLVASTPIVVEVNVEGEVATSTADPAVVMAETPEDLMTALPGLVAEGGLETLIRSEGNDEDKEIDVERVSASDYLFL